MFNAMRRCPTSLSRALLSKPIASTVSRAPIYQPSTLARQSTLRTPGFIAAFHQSATQWQQANNGLITEFQDLATRKLVHPNLIDTITTKMLITTMTDVQSRTINEALNGFDVIAQAKTGTGKTLGFLVPVVQRIIEEDPTLANRTRGPKRGRADNIRAIVISPTRELAEQIAVEARKVTSGTGLIVQCAVGGTQKQRMLQQTLREGCHLLVGTPGRLHDILSDSYSGIKAPNLNTLVMDEADRLLDEGFTQEINEIKKYLPDPEQIPRQTLMFSATIPRDVVNLARSTLRPGFHFAQCVDENEEPTHNRVPQKIVHVAGLENLMPSLYEIILREQQAASSGEARPFKAIVYYNSTAEVNLAASVFYKLAGGFKRGGPLHGLASYEIHAKLSQAVRTKAADGFRFATSGILFSSDVTARGMDFPNVTHVFQIGLPRERDIYIHRLGRTGRAGKEGEGWLFLSPLERDEFSKRLSNLPLQEDTSLQTAALDLSQSTELPETAANIVKEVVQVHKRVYPDQLEAAFRGLFGSYQWYPNRSDLLEAANRLAEFGWGMPQPPNPPSSFFSVGRRQSSRSGTNTRSDNNRRGERHNRYSNDRMDNRSRGGHTGARNHDRTDKWSGPRVGSRQDRFSRKNGRESQNSNFDF